MHEQGIGFAKSGDDADVLCLQTLRAALHVELDSLPFLKAAEALRLDNALMTEHIFTPVFLADEAKALRIVEPLHSTLCHLRSAFRRSGGNEHRTGRTPRRRAAGWYRICFAKSAIFRP